MWGFLFKVFSYEEVNGKSIKTYHLLRAKTYVEAVEVIENYYGDTLERFEVQCIEDEVGLISEDLYKMLVAGEDFVYEVAENE